MNKILEIAQKASDLANSFYIKEVLETKRKADKSFVSEADLAVSEFIIDQLQKLKFGYPIISEEGDDIKNAQIIKEADIFWLIDPIDGTSSFLNKTGEFTINIALIKNNEPTFGIICAPLQKSIYYGDLNAYEAYKIEDGVASKIQPNKRYTDGYDFLISSQNISQKTQDFIDKYSINTITLIPSAIKFALLAEGKGHIYPRFRKTYIWDTASGHAILKAVGGDVVDLKGHPLSYNQNLANPDFIALSNVELIDELKFI